MPARRGPLFVAGIDRLLTEQAEKAAARAGRSQKPWTHGGHAITAIILAAAGVEAHVGEWLARPPNRGRFTPDELADFRRQPANEVIKGIIKMRTPTFDFNTPVWYRDLVALHQLRNHVVHYYPEKMETGTFPQGLVPHVGRNTTFRPIGNESHDWTSRLIVRSVALKAVKVAKEAQAQFDAAVAGW